jgi:hypothetical protein
MSRARSLFLAGFAAMQLVHGTEPFKPSLVEVILGA